MWSRMKVTRTKVYTGTIISFRFWRMQECNFWAVVVGDFAFVFGHLDCVGNLCLKESMFMFE